ncbi:probable sugar phosphate/phosphate translocator At3g11320 [Lycium barbarum]|uniref:probable sugar phosphate/phosphate translocator At3g11320 n=1 Tax=Lycium barbarum TaxID=112863 RepID=UPI00293E4A3B|nr:probable sugar phosphate/phosphate translocator At3g11320 [Lycium barbarum]
MSQSLLLIFTSAVGFYMLSLEQMDYSCCGLRSKLGFPGEGILIPCQSFNYGQGEPSFHLFGFIMCVGATAARALKSVLQGILLSSEGEKLNSMNLLLYMAPIAVVFLLPATLLMEENVVGITLALARDDSRIIWLLLFNSSLAYFVNLTNFLVTKHR